MSNQFRVYVSGDGKAEMVALPDGTHVFRAGSVAPPECEITVSVTVGKAPATAADIEELARRAADAIRRRAADNKGVCRAG